MSWNADSLQTLSELLTKLDGEDTLDAPNDDHDDDDDDVQSLRNFQQVELVVTAFRREIRAAGLMNFDKLQSITGKRL